MQLPDASIGRLLALDPGTTQTGWVVFDGSRVIASGTDTNDDVLIGCQMWSSDLSIEGFDARGMPLGQESITTIEWAGRFRGAWEALWGLRFVKVSRKDVKLHFCGSSRAKDANVRAAIIDQFGGKDKAIGKKANPGPLYGVSSHAWAALGVAIIARLKMDGR